jgi:trans-AT polyketide synthase/acyltransferase/oxidoreductase domain-containing protein
MTTLNPFKPNGCWHSEGSPPEPLASALQRTLLNVSRPVYVVERPDGLYVSQGGSAALGAQAQAGGDRLPLRAYAPPLPPQALGEPAFKVKHGLRYAYVAGEMANGITSVRMVTAVGQAGMLGFFGAAGLMPAEVETALSRLQSELPGLPFGVNLIHSPGNLELEAALADLFLRRKVRLVSASAYVDLTYPLVHYRVKGIHRDADGCIVCPNRVAAKVSRVEVARKFLAPPPEKILGQLVDRGLITAEEATLAAADEGARSGIYNVGTGKATSLRAVGAGCTRRKAPSVRRSWRPVTSSRITRTSWSRWTHASWTSSTSSLAARQRATLEVSDA